MGRLSEIKAYFFHFLEHFITVVLSRFCFVFGVFFEILEVNTILFVVIKAQNDSML